MKPNAKDVVMFPGTALLMTLLMVFCASLAQSTTTPATDADWPRRVKKDNAVLLYHQPQIDEWNDYRQIKGRMTFSLTAHKKRPVAGVATIQCGSIVNKEKRTVYFRNLVYEDVKFSSLDEDSVRIMTRLFMELAPQGGELVSLDHIMADLLKTGKQPNPPVLNNDPPAIFYTEAPAVLLVVYGEPVTMPVEKTDLEFVVNANRDLFYDKKEKNYYLLLNDLWLGSKELKGPWTQAKALPAGLSRLPAGTYFDELEKTVHAPSFHGIGPDVVYSDKPAELIQTKGKPVYRKVQGTHLQYVTNTTNDLFLYDFDKEFYVLFSGRWFRARSLDGPWVFASNDLPASFTKIPSTSPKANVLVSVPGTVEASKAVILAQIPTTTIINKAEAEKKVKVHYNGEPQFKSIEGTPLEYAVNTREKVINLGDRYYLCFQAVWFVSSTPQGPWETADDVPKEIYSIPPKSPLYNVTYVTQTNETETTVESSVTGGYSGTYILGMTMGACIAYGTGYYYPPNYSSAAFTQTITDPLPSWNDGPVKQSIIAYVTKISDSNNTGFIPVKDRIATFDNDGTLWAEQPIVQELFAIYQVKKMVAKNPALKNQHPYKAVIEKDKAYFKNDREKTAVQLIAATHTGMTEDEFESSVKDFFANAIYPGRNVPIRNVVYQPQLELLHYLRANGFKTFICSGGTVEFVRGISEELYGIPRYQVIGTTFKYKFIDSTLKIMREPAIALVNDKEGKPVGIQMHIGQRPVFACGNERSGGDIAMLKYSQSSSYPSFQLLINHDDAEREFAYSESNNASLNAAKANNWHVVNMKSDWKVVFKQ